MVPRIAAIHPKILGESCVLCYTLHSKECSPGGAAVQAYLDKRQIRKSIAVRFGMGASPDRWDGLLTAMTRRGYTKEELLALFGRTRSRGPDVF